MIGLKNVFDHNKIHVVDEGSVVSVYGNFLSEKKSLLARSHQLCHCVLCFVLGHDQARSKIRRPKDPTTISKLVEEEWLTKQAAKNVRNEQGICDSSGHGSRAHKLSH